MITVANKHHLPPNWQSNPDYLYIGRGSIWGNPYRMQNKSIAQREYVVTLYTEYLLSGANLLSQLANLQGKTLVCSCAPKLCHGHILMVLADRDIWRKVDTTLPQLMFGEIQRTASLYDIASNIKSCVDRMRRVALERPSDTDYQNALQSEAQAKAEYDYWQRQPQTPENSERKLRAKLAHDKAHEERYQCGGAIHGANMDTNRMTGQIQHALMDWRMWQKENAA